MPPSRRRADRAAVLRWRKSKAPDLGPGLCRVSDRRADQNRIVDAGAADVARERYLVGNRAAGDAAIEVAEIDVEIFGLQAPWLLTANSTPAPAVQPALVSSETLTPGESRLHVADREAAGDVGQEAIEGVAGARACSAEPVIAGLAARRAAVERAAVDVGPIEVALDAEHPRSGLPVVADGAADETARQVKVSGPAPSRTDPSRRRRSHRYRTRSSCRPARCTAALWDRLIATRQIGGQCGICQSRQGQNANAR